MTRSTDNTEKLLIELTSKIDNLGKDIKQELINIDKRLVAIETRMDEQKSSIGKIPKLAEKVGELKNWRQIAIIIITGTVGTLFGWFVKSGRF
ncbi:MAG: DUF1664 domain-containing protein [Xenococcaceae cyanobacterium MO_188.B32]|nr:DUF1664 domain-containing protein [Xenococcaceae cyanobacterium MO_188.B32]